MGAEPWSVLTDYQNDIQNALFECQNREFAEGNYDPYGILEQEDIKPDSIDELREMMEDSGTGTVMDMLRISDQPDFFSACPLPAERLLSLYGTDKPTREMVSINQDFFNDIDRGQGRYIVVYKDQAPDGILFAGYSFD